MIVDEFPNLVESICKTYLDSLSSYTKEKFGIKNENLFCKKVEEEYKELFKDFKTNKKVFKRKVLKLTSLFYKKGLSLAFIIDIINKLVRNFLIKINAEGLPAELSEEVLSFVEELTNLLAYSFIRLSIKEKRKLIPVKTFGFTRTVDESLISWLYTVEGLIEGEDRSIPIRDDCKLQSIFNSIDFKIGCGKLKTCKELFRIHNLIHVYFLLFSDYVKSKNFIPAYLILKEIYLLFEKLHDGIASVESVLSRLTSEDVLSYLIKENVKDSNGFTLLILNPLELSYINKVYGFRTGNTILDEITNELKAFFGEHNVLRCVDGLICGIKFSINESDIDKQRKLFFHLKEEIYSKFSSLVPIPDISGFLLIFPPNVKIDKQKAINLIKYARRLSKENPKELLVLNVKELIESKNVQLFISTVDYLKEKLEEGKVALAVQGIHSIETGEVIHKEILFRLVHEDGRIIPAGEVIDLIYNFRLIHLLDLAVLRKLKQNYKVFKGEKIFINISPQTLKFNSTRSEIMETLKFLTNKMNLGVEITEQAVVKDYSLLKEVFQDFSLNIALDDFGTGYSSFSNLIDFIESFPVKFLKIDGSYVQKLETGSQKAEMVISAITSMSHSLGIKVIAEFVSSEKVRQKLKEIGVDYAQGYLFSKPELVVV